MRSRGNKAVTLITEKNAAGCKSGELSPWQRKSLMSLGHVARKLMRQLCKRHICLHSRYAKAPSQNPFTVDAEKDYTHRKFVGESIFRNIIAISAATYRGAKCPTLKTAEKQPKRMPCGSRWSSRKTAGKTAETPEKQLFWLVFGCFSGVSAVFPAVFRLLHRDPLGTRHPFRLFFGCFQCRAFGTSVGGRGDCKNITYFLALIRINFWNLWISVS